MWLYDFFACLRAQNIYFVLLHVQIGPLTTPTGGQLRNEETFYFYSCLVKLTVDSGRMRQSQNYHRTGLVKEGKFF